MVEVGHNVAHFGSPSVLRFYYEIHFAVEGKESEWHLDSRTPLRGGREGVVIVAEGCRGLAHIIEIAFRGQSVESVAVKRQVVTKKAEIDDLVIFNLGAASGIDYLHVDGAFGVNLIIWSIGAVLENRISGDVRYHALVDKKAVHGFVLVVEHLGIACATAA